MLREEHQKKFSNKELLPSKKKVSRQYIVEHFPNVTDELDGKSSLDFYGNRSAE